MVDFEIMLRSPAILTGRGGSGTRLLSEIAQKAGVFLGNELNFAGDSVEWVDIIYAACIEKLSLIDRGLTVPLDTWRSKFQDRANEIVTAGNCARGTLWGWKLPESMIIIPELLEIFPNAKLVHMVRHPVHISLRRTHMTSRTNNPIGQAVVNAAYKSLGCSPATIEHHEEYMHNAISWLFQVSSATDFLRKNLNPNQYLEVRFEDLCSHPVETEQRILRFIGISTESQQPPIVDTNRMVTFDVEDLRVSEIWNLCKATATKLGYSQPE